MRIAKVIGTVTLSRYHPTFKGATLKVVVPLALENLTGEAEAMAEEVVAWDDLGAGIGDQIALSEGLEAARPFRPEPKPVDAYNTAILDHIDLRTDLVRRPGRSQCELPLGGELTRNHSKRPDNDVRNIRSKGH
jgi:ethanolamine utilization protein EutN